MVIYCTILCHAIFYSVLFYDTKLYHILKNALPSLHYIILSCTRSHHVFAFAYYIVL